MSSRPQRFTAYLRALAGLSLSAALLFSGTARAEKVLLKEDNWEVYTDGRVAAFASYVNGEGRPVATKTITLPNGTTTPEVINGGEWAVSSESRSDTVQGSVNMWRVRSGFIGNTLGFGVRNQIVPNLKATAYIQIWAFVESDTQGKGNPNPPDARQGYGKIEGNWGSFTAGRTRTLFSRGATDIDVMYAHRWGVGFPNGVSTRGPTPGMVGFGVLGSGFGAGLIYGTPTFAGLHLDVGLFDPAALAAGGWSRTSFARPEGELTFEQPLGGIGKVVLFTNGTYQKVWKAGHCPAQPCTETAKGFGYGGRIELGPVHLGVAGHYGKGLGLNYALEQSPAAIDGQTHLRAFDGYYVQSQVVVNKFDFFAGWGITRVFLTADDLSKPQNSNIKSQMGINGGVVFNPSPNLHFDLEYFRADAEWWLGEHQRLNCFASGMTVSW